MMFEKHGVKIRHDVSEIIRSNFGKNAESYSKSSVWSDSYSRKDY